MGESVPGRGSSKCKGPEVRAQSRKSKEALLAGMEEVTRRSRR